MSDEIIVVECRSLLLDLSAKSKRIEYVFVLLLSDINIISICILRYRLFNVKKYCEVLGSNITICPIVYIYLNCHAIKMNSQKNLK